MRRIFISHISLEPSIDPFLICFCSFYLVFCLFVSCCIIIIIIIIIIVVVVVVVVVVDDVVVDSSVVVEGERIVKMLSVRHKI